MKNKTALLVIDIQDNYFPIGLNPLEKPHEASEQATVLLNFFRKEKKLVVFIKHDFKKHSHIHSSVSPAEGEKIITKNQINSYLGTDLLEFLQTNAIKKVVICGMMTHVCVEAAARASADYGFEVIVIGDACATKNIIYENVTVKARDVHIAVLATIASYYGTVMSVDEFLRK